MIQVILEKRVCFQMEKINKYVSFSSFQINCVWLLTRSSQMVSKWYRRIELGSTYIVFKKKLIWCENLLSSAISRIAYLLTVNDMRITFMFTKSVGHSALFEILNRFGKWRPRKFINIKTITFNTQVFVLNSCKKKLIWVWHFADANRVKDFQWNCQNKHFHACMQYSILSKVICMYWRSFYGFPPLARFTIMPSQSNDKQFVSFDIIL